MRINRFRIRLFLIITASLLIPVLLCCIILYSTTESTIKAYTSNNISTTLKANMHNIEAKLDVVDSASTSLLLTLAQVPELTDKSMESSPVQIFRAVEQAFTVHSSLIVNTYSINGFNHFYLYFPKKSLLIISKMSFFEDVNYNDVDCLVIPEDTWGVATPYNHLISNPLLGKHMNERNITRNYIPDTGFLTDIILSVNVKEDYINDLLISGLQNKPDYAIIIDPNGNIFSSMNKEEIGKSIPAYHTFLEKIQQVTSDDNAPPDYLEITIDETTYLVNWEYSHIHNWYYITALDIKTVTNSISAILDTMYIMLVALIGLSLIVTVIIVKSTTFPLRKLNSAIEELKNKNFKVQLDVKNGDEFEAIYSGFNEMVKEIDELINTITKERNLNTETHIRLLQSEINPHMLYNSLESLYSMAKINNQEESANLVMALSKFFRISLSGGKRLVPFRDAFELANQYIIVQNIRLNYKIDFEHDIPESIMGIRTPKFLLQPLVENSIQYGFSNRRETCRILIKAYYEDDYTIIIVEDNGIGIHETELSIINKNINNFNFEETVAAKGYALRNINYQLKLKYGDPYGLHLESSYGEYTRVIIRLPRKTY